MSDVQPESGRADIDGHDAILSEPKRIVLTSGQKIGVCALAALIFLLFIWVDHSFHTKDAGHQPELAARPEEDTFRTAPLSLPPAAAPDSVPEHPVAQSTQKPQGNSPEESAVLAYSGSAASATAASDQPQSAQVVPAIGRKAAAAVATGEATLATRLQPTVLDAAQASLLPHPDFLITKGTLIACTLQSAINSELAGYVKCVLPEAVRSTTGHVVLLDRGTTIVGEVQSGLSGGQKRVFILWTRAETPDHAVISLASPGSDELGQSGVPGAVNNHFMERFGGAIMLSVLQGGLQAGTALAGNSGSGAGTYFNSFQSNGQQVVDNSLQSSMNIPPVLEKNQGESVSIFVARDLDFSGVYSLALAHR